MQPSTFSIVAADRQTREVGVAVQSKFLSVGAVVPFVRCHGGAIATQAFANTAYGPKALTLLEAGTRPQRVAELLIRDDEGREDRQFGIVSTAAGAATFTGSSCIAWAGGTTGEDFAAQGNCLTGASVVEALAQFFEIRAAGLPTGS